MKLMKSCFSVLAIDYDPEDGALLDSSGVIASVISFIEHDTISTLLPTSPSPSSSTEKDSKEKRRSSSNDSGRREMMIEKKKLFDLAHQFLELGAHPGPSLL